MNEGHAASIVLELDSPLLLRHLQLPPFILSAAHSSRLILSESSTPHFRSSSYLQFNMADLDDELLALAGGDSSESEGEIQENEPLSPPPDSSNDRDRQKDKDAGGKAGRKGVARPAPRRKKSKKDDSDEEEGEVYVFRLSETELSLRTGANTSQCLVAGLSKLPRVRSHERVRCRRRV